MAVVNVKNKSLSHHFRDKNEIVPGAAELALSGIGVPAEADEHWAQWLLGSARLYRDALLAHPALITVMLARRPFWFGFAPFDEIVRQLQAQGVSPSATIALIEAIESFAIGNVLCKTSARTGKPKPSDMKHIHRSIHDALTHRSLKYDRQFANRLPPVN